jgi:hypothetical protein
VNQQIEHVLNQRNPSLSVTASGSANRLLYPDPVRHMSVLSRPVERAIANCNDLYHRLERVVDTDLAASPHRPAPYKRMQHRSVGRSARNQETRRAYHRPARASGSWTARSAWRSRRRQDFQSPR